MKNAANWENYKMNGKSLHTSDVQSWCAKLRLRHANIFNTNCLNMRWCTVFSPDWEKRQSHTALFCSHWHAVSKKRCNISELGTLKLTNYSFVSVCSRCWVQESYPQWFAWGFKWAVGQMTQPIVHCIFVFSVRKATTPQQATPQACCDIWH